jgi:hypothetical protein
MQITVVRSGGVAGMRPLTWKVNSQELRESDARALQDLVQRSNFFSAHLQDIKNSKGADIFAYTITVETPESSRTLKIQAEEGRYPEALRSLIDWVQIRATPSPY